MYLEWMGKNRLFVEKLIKYANMYASVYKKEEFYRTDIALSLEQIQVLEYLLENEQLNQNMAMIAHRLGITTSNFTRIVHKLSEKGLLKKYYVEGNRKNIVVRVTDYGKEQYQAYSKCIYEVSFSKMFEQIAEIPEEEMEMLAKGLEEAIWRKPEEIGRGRLIPINDKKE